METKWIWKKGGTKEDSYVEFFSSFEAKGSNALLKVACDTEFALFVNGLYVYSGAFQTFENYVLEEIEIPTKPGKNNLSIVVYHNGVKGFLNYYANSAGLFFEVWENEKKIVSSNEQTKSRFAPYFVNNQKKMITCQLGFQQFLDFTKINEEYESSEAVNKSCSFLKRINKRNVVSGFVNAEPIFNNVYDLKRESSGFLSFEIVSESQQNIEVYFGEHLIDGHVPYEIGPRGFRFSFKLEKGTNSFTSYLRRIGCRYLEIKSESNLLVHNIGIVETSYPFIEGKKFSKLTVLEQSIVDISKHTLKCCYFNHYEDCPWREQGLYGMDSRAAFLSQYSVFENTENILSDLSLLFSKTLPNGLLPITSPTDNDLVLPSFSIYPILSVYDYFQKTNNIGFLQEVFPKINGIIECFLNNRKNGLVRCFNQPGYWNFYEWNNGLDGNDGINQEFDLILNCLVVYGLQTLRKICSVLDEKFLYETDLNQLVNQINETFYNDEIGMYFFSKENRIYSQFGNALTILTGISKNPLVVANNILNNSIMIKTTIGGSLYVYESLLTFGDKFKKVIRSLINDNYKNMINRGATTFFETLKGHEDFGGAGSLCHAWAAIPLYLYRKII